MTLATRSLLDGLISASLAAGREILDVYGAPIDVDLKADLTPVTEADQRAELSILAVLAELAPGVPVVAEESVAVGRVPAITDRFFLVDPLDGTKEFIDRNGDFTVNIALIEHRVPVLGVVYAPAIGWMFIGSPDGAFAAMVVDSTPGAFSPVGVRQAPTEGPTVVESRSHRTPATDAYITRLRPGEVKMVGSSLKFCLLASGQADVYPRFGRTMEWDTAAGDAVLRAAGGSMTTVDGKPFLYGKRNRPDDADFANPFFIATGYPGILPD